MPLKNQRYEFLHLVMTCCIIVKFCTKGGEYDEKIGCYLRNFRTPCDFCRRMCEKEGSATAGDTPCHNTGSGRDTGNTVETFPILPGFPEFVYLSPGGSFSSLRKTSTDFLITSIGAARPVHISNESAPCQSSIESPSRNGTLSRFAA